MEISLRLWIRRKICNYNSYKIFQTDALFPLCFFHTTATNPFFSQYPNSAPVAAVKFAPCFASVIASSPNPSTTSVSFYCFFPCTVNLLMNKVAVIPTYCNLLFNSAALVQYVAIRCSSNQRALINSRPNEI